MGCSQEHKGIMRLSKTNEILSQIYQGLQNHCSTIDSTNEERGIQMKWGGREVFKEVKIGIDYMVNPSLIRYYEGI